MFSRRGFSLVEVLIALLVLAIGVLGILGMQLHTLRITRDIAAQSLALQLAVDIAETVRGGADSAEMLEAFEHFDYAANEDLGSHAASDSGLRLASASAGSTCYGADSRCTPAQLAAFEMRDWRSRIRQLPGGRVRVCRDMAPWDSTQHSIRWDCDSTSDATRTLAPLWIKASWQGTASKLATPLGTSLGTPLGTFLVTRLVTPLAKPPAPQLLLPLAVFSQ